MKKLFFISFLFTIFSFHSIAATFNWTKFDVTKDQDTELYYDEATIFKVGSYKFYWVLSNYLKNIENNTRSFISHHMANCKTNEVKMISWTFFDGQMGKGNIQFDFIDPEEYPEKFIWNYYEPKKTIYGDMLKNICNLK